MYDALIVGGGPAGAVAAAHCAAAGLRTIVIERAVFPREKVCGDCVNPACWPIFERLGVSARVRALPHAELTAVDFIDMDGRRVTCDIAGRGEIAVKRSHLDQLLLTRAAELGAEVRPGAPVLRAGRVGEQWRIETEGESFSARWLLAADGRNSTVARLLDLLPAARKDRVAQQTHFPLPAGAAGRVRMCFLHEGYSGLADAGDGIANLCLVARPEKMAALRERAARLYSLSAGQEWRTITPLDRRPARPAGENLLLLGDAARVVEPFTGEGIYYAIATGELAADCLRRGRPHDYPLRHELLYRRRLWVNQLARFACLHPGFASRFLRLASFFPSLLDMLTANIVRPVR